LDGSLDPLRAPPISTEDVPRGAELLACSVSTLVPDVGLGLNDAVTPAGSVGAVRVIEPVTFPRGTKVRVEVTDFPWTIVTGIGEASILKFHPWSHRGIVVVSLSAPDVPVMVRMLSALETELLAVSVSTLLPVVGFALQDAVTPLGRPEVTARLTLPVNPALLVTRIVAELEVPG
jgi:hypothetical protein